MFIKVKIESKDPFLSHSILDVTPTPFLTVTNTSCTECRVSLYGSFKVYFVARYVIISNATLKPEVMTVYLSFLLFSETMSHILVVVFVQIKGLTAIDNLEGVDMETIRLDLAADVSFKSLFC